MYRLRRHSHLAFTVGAETAMKFAECAKKEFMDSATGRRWGNTFRGKNRTRGFSYAPIVDFREFNIFQHFSETVASIFAMLLQVSAVLSLKV